MLLCVSTCLILALSTWFLSTQRSHGLPLGLCPIHEDVPERHLHDFFNLIPRDALNSTVHPRFSSYQHICKLADRMRGADGIRAKCYKTLYENTDMSLVFKYFEDFGIPHRTFLRRLAKLLMVSFDDATAQVEPICSNTTMTNRTEVPVYQFMMHLWTKINLTAFDQLFKFKAKHCPLFREIVFSVNMHFVIKNLRAVDNTTEECYKEIMGGGYDLNWLVHAWGGVSKTPFYYHGEVHNTTTEKIK